MYNTLLVAFREHKELMWDTIIVVHTNNFFVISLCIKGAKAGVMKIYTSHKIGYPTYRFHAGLGIPL